jgi:hypothetical protein
MQVSDFDRSYFESRISKGVPGFPVYAMNLKKTLQKLEAAFGGTSSSGCVGCQSTPTLKLYSWEKID